MPFLIAAALVVALTAGSRSRFRTQADIADEEDRARAAAAKVQVQGWGDTKRWFFWYVYFDGKLTSSGPTQMTDAEAFHYEDNTHRATMGVKMYRFVWPGHDPWIYDTRTPPRLLAGAALPYQDGKVIAGDDVGAVAVRPPLRGRWTAPGFPETVTMNGRVFRKAQWKWPRSGVVAQYREAVPVNSHHLFVLENGTFVVDHYDEANPDQGAALEHLWKDVILRPSGMS